MQRVDYPFSPGRARRQLIRRGLGHSALLRAQRCSPRAPNCASTPALLPWPSAVRQKSPPTRLEPPVDHFEPAIFSATNSTRRSGELCTMMLPIVSICRSGGPPARVAALTDAWWRPPANCQHAAAPAGRRMDLRSTSCSIGTSRRFVRLRRSPQSPSRQRRCASISSCIAQPKRSPPYIHQPINANPDATNALTLRNPPTSEKYDAQSR